MNTQGPLPEESAKYLFKQLLEGVGYCHRMGTTHRDLKPSNILLCGTMDRPIAKITDFGTARDAAQMTTYCGTPDFAAPEVVLGNPFGERKSYDNKVDMWSLGIILFMMFVPFLYESQQQ